MNKTIFVALLLFISCSKEIPFDKELWNERSDVFYDYREYMINDLVQNHLHREMSYSEVLNLLGKPTIYGSTKNERKLDYEIIEKYGWDIDPDETQYLTITLDQDSTLDKVYLNIWKANKGTKIIELKTK